MSSAMQLLENIPWIPHKLATGAQIKTMISKRDDNLDVTCVLVSLPKGVEIPEHIHEAQDDILFPLTGKATMWDHGSGDFSLEPGVIVRVPKGTRHKIFAVTEDMTIYDVFCPATL